jgi:hypothetical protein
LRDKVGAEIEAGRVIAYGHALGRCAALQVGLVLEVREATDPHKTTGNGASRIRVRGFNRDERWSHWEPGKAWAPLSKDSYVWFPERCAVLAALEDAELLAAVRKFREGIA